MFLILKEGMKFMKTYFSSSNNFMGGFYLVMGSFVLLNKKSQTMFIGWLERWFCTLLLVWVNKSITLVRILMWCYQFTLVWISILFTWIMRNSMEFFWAVQKHIIVFFCISAELFAWLELLVSDWAFAVVWTHMNTYRKINRYWSYQLRCFSYWLNWSEDMWPHLDLWHMAFKFAWSYNLHYLDVCLFFYAEGFLWWVTTLSDHLEDYFLDFEGVDSIAPQTFKFLGFCLDYMVENVFLVLFFSFMSYCKGLWWLNPFFFEFNEKEYSWQMLRFDLVTNWHVVCSKWN